MAIRARPKHNRLHQNNQTAARPSGSVLLLVLLVVAMLALGTSSYLVMMQNEYRATHYSGRRQQALAFAQSGVAYLQAMLAQENAKIDEQGGLLDNPDMLQGVVVIDDPQAAFRGRFSVLAPGMDQGDYGSTRFGLENESAKLNLNSLLQRRRRAASGSSGTTGGSTANGNTSSGSTLSGETSEASTGQTTQDNTARERLLMLPGMDSEIADAILDWIDADDRPREFGAEADYYQQLAPAYKPANGPLTDLDELLAVRGVTPSLLYGIDTNRNYEVDPTESNRAAQLDTDTTDGLLDRGWSAYLTVASAERVANPDGEAKIDINMDNLQSLHNELTGVVDESQAAFIILLRQNGPMATETAGAASTQPPGSNPRQPAAGQSGQTVDPASITLDFNKKSKYQLGSLFDLVGVQVQVQDAKETATQIVGSPWPDEPGTYRNDWLKLEDHFAIGTAGQIVGRINVNQASRTVLQTLKGLSTSAVEQILTSRSEEVDLANDDQRHAVWLLAEGIVTLEEMKQLAPQITTRGDVYRGQVVGYFESGRPVARLEVLVDRLDGRPRLVGWQDLSSLGPGFTAELLGAEETASDAGE